MSDFADPRLAIAYLKALLPPDGGKADVELSAEDSPVILDLGNGLGVSYVVDEGNCFRYVQQRDLIHHRVDREDLNSNGIRNLTEIAARNTRIQPYGEIFAVLSGGNFEASLILLDSLWDQSLKQFVKGDYAVAIPARDILAFGDASSPKAIGGLQALIDRLFNSPSANHLLSDRIYLRSQGGWIQRPV